jgi:16S rRNA processing protein RimM
MEKVLIGEITAPFGVQGEVKIRLLVDSIDVLTQLPMVYLQSSLGQTAETRILKARFHQENMIVARVAAIADCNAAEGWRQAKIMANRSDMPVLPEDSYYEWELHGMTVVTESGKPMGVIEKIHRYPANDVYETDVAMIPAVGAFVKSIDVVERRMVVIDIIGLRKDE